VTFRKRHEVDPPHRMTPVARMRAIRLRTGPIVSAGLLGAMLIWRAGAQAHGIPRPLAFWGNYARDIAQCQQAISHAATQCVAQALDLRGRCFEVMLGGGVCDSNATQVAVTAVIVAAQREVAEVCRTQLQIQSLLFIDVAEAQSAVYTTCVEVSAATLSAAYAPVASRSGVLDAADQACISAAGDATERLVRSTIRARRRAFDFIAATDLTASRKRQRVARSATQIARRQARLSAALQSWCTPDQFAELYRLDIAAFLAHIAGQADCYTEFVYIQAAVTCPAYVCGNGLRETGEQCDDGNPIDDDQCTNACRVNHPPG